MRLDKAAARVVARWRRRLTHGITDRPGGGGGFPQPGNIAAAPNAPPGRAGRNAGIAREEGAIPAAHAQAPDHGA